MGVLAGLEQHRGEIERLCVAYGVRRLAVFGSAATGEFNPERSDVDLLVEFHDNREVKMFKTFFALQNELEELLDRPVDLVMRSAVRNPYVMKDIEATRQDLYAA